MMTHKQYLEEFKRITDEMYVLTAAKNADYAGGGEVDAFRNFTMVEELTLGSISTEQGFFTRMTDKMMRFASFIRKGTLEVADEKIEDTLQDIAVYAILFLCYRRSQRIERAEDKILL